ncbi:hypothetical protein C1637_19435 [Chryseobacterium lactis]|uniref:DUF2750 domain-containing protein n=1 Tax=Chryseobacterium lactis TaxID=1241981 RepID=A0A3G6RQ36_CHRLC|nr:hypothetical protein [Chryseobacterium lactis]AZA83175.1 hypothetical protein EG342_15390 [Chryseobacterium lactis]AZB03560.1 hypothetical protein EG341_06260 [Chryseobacterium lactis]PNW11934.1 hypothetical protein C1637_19435 [Chryseobacterium lactis]
MNIEQLREKAQPLIRKVLLFVSAQDSDEILAYASENESLRFVVKHADQWMGLKEDHDEFSFSPVMIETVDTSKYIPLTKRATEVYPPFETLMHYGDVKIQAWITENDGDKDDLSSLAAFAPDEYIDLWMDSHPMYSNDEIFAYEGGWAMIWPEDDEPMQWNEDLDFLFQIGLQDEPFIEVFYEKENEIYICMERNT